MNKVFISGRLTRDVEVKELGNDKKVAKGTLAVSDGYKENQKTSFYDLEIWNKTADIMDKYTSKGSEIVIFGRLKQETWEKDGQKKTNIKIIVEEVKLESKSKELGHEPETKGKQFDINDDDLAF